MGNFSEGATVFMEGSNSSIRLEILNYLSTKQNQHRMQQSTRVHFLTFLFIFAEGLQSSLIDSPPTFMSKIKWRWPHTIILFMGPEKSSEDKLLVNWVLITQHVYWLNINKIKPSSFNEMFYDSIIVISHSWIKINIFSRAKLSDTSF